jgi:hypothetical protein
MKVVWQEGDIKAGLAVCRGYNSAETRSIVMFQRIPNEGPRYCVCSLVKYEASEPKTKEGLADYLNTNGFVPSVLLTL